VTIAPKGGYLDPKTIPDTVLILPPAPKEGSPEAAADKVIYNETRALKGSTRWTLAARDAVNYLGAYDCALGVRLTPETTPRTLELLRRTGVDASKVTNLPKDHYGRPRPFVGSSDPICVEDQRSGLTRSASYPSGHATFGWSVGLILAEAAPDRAAEILSRARSFAESRVVCGVHNLSDVQMGMVAGSVLVAALHADAVFATDLAAAKAELAGARSAPGAAPLEPAMCAVQSDAEAHTPWDNPKTAK
jgi:acid phosphatase (class A)